MPIEDVLVEVVHITRVDVHPLDLDVVISV
jgi:hypothetical protein